MRYSLLFIGFVVLIDGVNGGFYHMPESKDYLIRYKNAHFLDSTLTKITKEESQNLSSICGRSTSKRKYPWAVSLALHVRILI
jgi:hypothetical protein